MKNTTTSNSATCFMAYPQVLGREKIKGLFHLLLFFALLTIATAVANAASPDSLYQLDRFSINAAGAIDDSSASYKLGLSVGQPVVGTASSASYQTGTGFWGEPSFFKSGDANGDGKVTVSDVIYIINYLFKGGPAPVPLEAGDANCDGKVTVSDVVYLINYLFKGGPAPC